MAYKDRKESPLKTFDLHTLSPQGDSKERSALLHQRLTEKDYSREYVFTPEAAEQWPGDWVGRAILAQTMQEWVLKKPSPRLPELLEELPKHFNSLGYLGPIYEKSACEQQLSGHGWLLRGLCAYYSYSKEARYLEMARNIVYQLFLPIRDLYKIYPINPADRTENGGMSGTTQGALGNWLVSSDTGCAFIPLDGVSDVYKLTGDEKIGELLKTMIDRFLEMDLLKIKAQTHATLTAARGILRFYTVNREPYYLNTVRKIFTLYTEHGMTVNFENQNWFDRPEWTEPCAVIDSFMVATQLYQETGELCYADWAQKILYNGLYHEQRTTGGFGCDTCGTDGIIRTHCFEASWCCTMRGGEGLAEVLKYGILADEEGLKIPYPLSMEADLMVEGKEIHLIEKAEYPYGDTVSFEVTGLQDTPCVIKVYSPEEKSYRSITLTGEAPKAILRLPRSVCAETTEKGRKIFYGPLLMAQNLNKSGEKEQGEGEFTLALEGLTLEPLGRLYRATREEQENAAMKVLI